MKNSSLDFQKLYNLAIDWLLLNGPRIIIAVVAFLVGQWIIRILRKWVEKALSRRGVHLSVIPFIQSLVITLLQVLLIVVIMQILGIQLTIFAAAVASLGVTVGLALSGTLQNFACGLLILFLKPFKTGDHILAQGQEGTVSSIQIFYTIIKTKDNRTVIIPNSKLSNEVIITIADEQGRKIDIEMKFNYQVDTNKVEEIISGAIGQSGDLLPQPPTVIGISQCENDGFKVKAEVWSSATKFEQAKRDLSKKIINDLKSNGISPGSVAAPAQ